MAKLIGSELYLECSEDRYRFKTSSLDSVQVERRGCGVVLPKLHDDDRGGGTDGVFMNVKSSSSTI